MQRTKLLQRLVGASLAMCLLIGLGTNVFISKAAQIDKVVKTYDIAVVFDNSGSMYDNKAWCRAKYAMEIFASMLNYENGDTLTVFPMWEVTTDGKTKEGGSYKPITIDSLVGIEKISSLYTTNPSSTPFEPITEAYEYLKHADSAKEKWLIVLTDGAFNQNKRGKQAAVDLQKKLSSLASERINVQYLGFGNATKLDSKPSKGFYAEKSTDESLKDDLITICNTIFKRAELPENCLKGTALELDLSMRKIIVFAQGKGAKVTSLKDSTGKSIAITLDSGQRKYSTIKAKGYENAPVDNTLYGQVVTFDSCAKGTYTLDCTGADTVQVFYEPDVDIGISFKNSDGQDVEPTGGKVTADTYKVYYSIVDSNTGEDVTDSVLMGKNVSLEGTLIDGDEKEFKLENGGNVNLEAGKKIYFRIKGTYLEDYTITTDDNKDAFTFDIEAPPTDSMTLNAEVQQPDDWYTLSEKDKWKPIRVELKYNGANLTDEQLKQVKWNIETDKPIEWKIDILPGESAANIYVGTNKDGQYVAPEVGEYTMKIWASVKDEYGQDVKTKTDKVDFQVQKFSALVGKILKLLPWIFALLVFIIWMSQKVLPKATPSEFHFYHGYDDEVNGGGAGKYLRKSKSMGVETRFERDPFLKCNASFKIQPIDRRWVKSKNRGFAVVGVSNVSSHVEEIHIGTHRLEKINNKWCKAIAPDKPLYIELRNNPTIQIVTEGAASRLTGKFIKK